MAPNFFFSTVSNHKPRYELFSLKVRQTLQQLVALEEKKKAVAFSPCVIKGDIIFKYNY